MRRMGCGVVVVAVVWVAGSDAWGQAVYWSDFGTGAIYRKAPGGNHELVVKDAGHPWGIAVDPVNRYLYWGDYDASTPAKIMRSNYDGSGQTVILSEPVVSGGGTQFVQNISLDLVHSAIYYTEANTRTLRRVGTDGTGDQVLVQGRLNGPVDVKLDLVSGYMYWTQIISSDSELYRARLDGSEQTLLFSDQGFYYDLALAPAQGDIYHGKYIYFADQHPNYFGIRRIGIDGSNPVTLVHQDGLMPSGMELDPVNGWLYWSRRDEPGIWRSDLNGNNVEQITDPGSFR